MRPDEAAHASAFGRVHFVWLGAAYLLFVVYGSLVPLTFRHVPLDEAIREFTNIPYLPLGIESRADWVANILLFVPLSYLLMAALCVDGGLRSGIALVLVVPVCVLFSIALEFTQIFFPPRTVSLNDVLAESLGTVAGGALWVAYGDEVTQWSRRLWSRNREAGLARLLLPGYLVLLLVIHVMPLDLTLSPAILYKKYKLGLVHFLPFQTPLEKHVWNVAYFLPVGVLVACVPNTWRTRRSWPKVLGAGLATAAFIEFLQLFVYTRHVDPSDVITGSAAVLAGWFAALSWTTSPSEDKNAPRDRPIGSGSRRAVPTRAPVSTAWLVASAVWLAGLAAVYWYPFKFDADPERIAGRLEQMSLLPLADYYRQSEYKSFDQVVRRGFLFVPLGALLALAGAPRRHRDSSGNFAPVALLCSAVAASVLEIGQFFLPNRYPSVTDVLVGCLGAWIGIALARRVQSALKRGPLHGGAARAAALTDGR